MPVENWRERLQECGDPELAGALVRSIEQLLEKAHYSLTVGASERNIAAKLAMLIHAEGLVAPEGRPWNVDIEYNRKGRRVKAINGLQVVVPDIILHHLGTDRNFLAIELKMGSSDQVDRKDHFKLAAYRKADELNYSHALFLRLGQKRYAGTVSCLAWV